MYRLLLFFCLLAVNGWAQISAPLASDAIRTFYTDGSPNDSIYVFCSPDAAGNPATGELTATPIGGAAPWDFEWGMFDKDLNTFVPFLMETDVATSTVSDLGSGGYNVIIKDDNGITVGCHIGWVFIDSTEVSIDPITPGCNPSLVLNGAVDSVRNFTYYNPPGNPFIINAATGITVCFNANHTWVSDLGFYLVGPPSCGSPIIELAPNPGNICNDDNNVQDLCFSTTAFTPYNTCAHNQGGPIGQPETGTWASSDPWDAIFGCDANAAGWKVMIYDCYALDVGVLTNATIQFLGFADCGPSIIEYDSGPISAPINDNSCNPVAASQYTVPPATPVEITLENTIEGFEWSTDNPDIVISNPTTSLTPIVSPAVTQDTWFYLTVTDNFGCVKVDSAFFDYTPASLPVIDTAGPYCLSGSSQVLTANPPGGDWSGVGIEDPINGIFNPATAGLGTHQIIYMDSAVCGGNDTTLVIVADEPTFSTNTIEVSCFGESDGVVILENIQDPYNPWSVEWYDDSGSLLQSSDDITTDTLFGIPAGNFTVVVTNDVGCQGESTVTIVEPPPVIADFEFGPQPTNVLNTTIFFTNTSSGYSFSSWDFSGLGTSQENDPNFVFPDLEAGTYTVTLSVENDNGCIDTQSYDVFIGPNPEVLIFVPNSFSPNNGDKLNDCFGPVGSGEINLDTYSFRVFNRWGKMVFETNSIEECWDGNIDGGNSGSEQFFVWTLQVKDGDGEAINLKGHVFVAGN